MINSETIYFETIGNTNVDEVIKISVRSAQELGINKIVIFAATKSSVLKLEECSKNLNIQLIIATYSRNRQFTIVDADGNNQDIIVELGSPDVQKEFISKNILLAQGSLPLDPILSQTGDNATEMIVSSLNLISQGLTLCVNGAIMACENGYVNEGERIITMTGDTAIVCCTSIKRNLFSDIFKIERILCKPL